MSSDFDVLYAEIGLPALTNWSGESLTYTTKGGTATTCTGLVEAEETREEDDEFGRRQRIVRRVRIAIADVADPGTNATVTIGGVTYEVESIEAKSASVSTLTLVRLPSVERSRPGYRRR